MINYHYSSADAGVQHCNNSKGDEDVGLGYNYIARIFQNIR